jgi:hypothetical protein
MQSKPDFDTMLQRHLPAESIAAPKSTPTLKAITKRKAEVVDLELYEETVKKPFVPVIKSPAQKEEAAPYQILVMVNSKLDKFPSALRETLQKAYQTACYTQMFALQAGKIPNYHKTYRVIEGQCTRSESFAFDNKTLHPSILDLSMANIKLLELLANRCTEKTVFVELKTQSGLVNPGFVELHSVRHGELGWGFDADGCLSLYVPRVVEKKLRERVWYVELGGIKIEDEI